MKQGSTVIFNEEYIDELTRHRDIAQRKFDVETFDKPKAKAKAELEYWENKLEKALEFSDTIDCVQNMDVPSITVIKTLRGHEIPARHVQLV